MGIAIPDDVREIVDSPIFAHIATIDDDGSPQLSVIWFERNGDTIRFSTVEGRAKPRNLRRDARCTISFAPLDNAYRNIVIRGRAVSLENAGMGMIDRLANKYLGVEKYEWSRPEEVRVDVTVEVERISG
ncbi:MAG: PPOX class F420-dependent oxidoreductase [Acidimicrobiia bacterium]